MNRNTTPRAASAPVAAAPEAPPPAQQTLEEGPPPPEAPPPAEPEAPPTVRVRALIDLPEYSAPAGTECEVPADMVAELKRLSYVDDIVSAPQA